jgi:hypothetical protein
VEHNVTEGRQVADEARGNPQVTHRTQLADKIAKLRLTRVPSHRHRMRNKAKAKAK